MAVNLNLGDFNVYRTDFLMQVPAKLLQQEYARLRTIYNKRSAAMERSEFASNPRYNNVKGIRFNTPTNVKGVELAEATAELASILQWDLPGVAALKRQRAQNLRTLHEHGFKNINKDNYDDFVEFMEDVRSFYGTRAYDSDRVAELFNIAEKKGIDADDLQEDMDFWLENMDKLKYAKTHNADGSQRTAEDYRKAITRRT